jgi:hypothetical protein
MIDPPCLELLHKVNGVEEAMQCLQQRIVLDDGDARPSIAPSTTSHVRKQEKFHGE